MNQSIENNSPINKQVNIAENYGPISFANTSKLSRRFEMLKNEVSQDIRYDGVIDALEYYLTNLDGVDMPTKLRHGGYSEKDINLATIRKEKYWKKSEKNKNYESAQRIDNELFAKILILFEADVEPLINDGATRDSIYKAVVNQVVEPVLHLINSNGEHDDVLNYDAVDILGMIYFLTGKCHINWKNYDNL